MALTYKKVADMMSEDFLIIPSWKYRALMAYSLSDVAATLWLTRPELVSTVERRVAFGVEQLLYMSENYPSPEQKIADTIANIYNYELRSETSARPYPVTTQLVAGESRSFTVEDFIDAFNGLCR